MASVLPYSIMGSAVNAYITLIGKGRNEVRYISLILNVGNVFRRNLFLSNLFPINICEPRMIFNFLSVFAANSLVRIFVKQSLDYILAFDGGIGFGRIKVHLMMEDVREHGVMVVVIERSSAIYQLVDEHAECPPVYGEGCSASLYYFGT